MSMPGAFEDAESPASSSLPLYESDVREVVERAGYWRHHDEVDVQNGEPSTPSRVQNIVGSSWLDKCYGSVRRFIGSGTKRHPQDTETAITDGRHPRYDTVLEPKSLIGKPFQDVQSIDTESDGDGSESYHTAIDPHHQSAIRFGLASLTIGSDSSPRLLTDEENERMNRKIDRLIAAIDGGRPIHFANSAETGEVDIFADHHGQESDQDEYELEHMIDAAPENFGRMIKSGNGVRRIRSLHSLPYASSTDSWVSTDSRKSSSNAWERAIAVANIGFALEHGDWDQEATVIRQPFRRPETEIEVPWGRRLVRTTSPVRLDFNKPLRMSTPSIHSSNSELDTSSPLFRKSCERILRETYAQPPESKFERVFPEHSQLDEWAFVSEPRNEVSPEARELQSPSTTRRAFGVFGDASNGESSSKKFKKPAVGLKALKDISNLRRPGYLQFNSFAKDAKLANNQARTAVTATASSMGFGGANDPESRRAYIDSKWPGLLNHRANDRLAERSSLDGRARRHNEQKIGHPIDESHYSLSHVRTPAVDSSLSIDPVRQAHFDLALARLEGHALPPPPSPIRRHPDAAALFDLDVQIEGSHRPLPLRSPMPIRPTNLTPRWAVQPHFE